jgi:hypothetical protein
MTCASLFADGGRAQESVYDGCFGYIDFAGFSGYKSSGYSCQASGAKCGEELANVVSALAMIPRRVALSWQLRPVVAFAPISILSKGDELPPRESGPFAVN